MNYTEKYSLKSALTRFYQLISLEREEITAVYFYAIINGLILLSLPLGIQAIINLLFGGTVSTSLVVLIGVVISGVLLNGIFQIYQMRIIERMQQRIFTRLTFAYTYRIPRISLLSIDEYYLPELVNRFFDTANLQKGLSKLLLDFPSATIQILFGLILLSFYHPVFIIFAIVILIVVVLILYFTSSKGFNTSMAESEYKYHVAHWLEEISRAIKTFKFNQGHELHLNRTDKLLTGYLDSRQAHFSVLIFQYRILVAFKVLITATMLIIGSVLFIRQQINLGQFIAAEIVILTILASIEKMIVSLEVVYDVLTSLEKLNQVLDKPQDEADELYTRSFLSDGMGIDIKLNSLSFGYSGNKPVINGIDLHIQRGEKICLMGAEGSGKSTLLSLLAGIYTGFSGNILFNDVPLKTISTRQLHQKVAVFLADGELFTGTIHENLTVGNQKITFGELDAICEIVGLSSYIRSQQKGYQTYLDPHGRRLSYNIAQKLLLVRCLAIKPDLLLLEDGWAGIEPTARERVIHYLTGSSVNFTMIAVTNDEGFAARCDRIVYLEKGSILSSSN
ncbi:peptidase domain-containing ABC transporter [Daejeonella sp.]|uniref:peptidase domain-containing ABC transporter n=1 Tax=Daejeonella sp. TaxID=2805397 RepID=UPI0039831FD2